jgi:hypothetical protein
MLANASALPVTMCIRFDCRKPLSARRTQGTEAFGRRHWRLPDAMALVLLRLDCQ